MLGVLDPKSPVAYAVRRFGVGEDVKQPVISLIADGVHGDVQTGGVGVQDPLSEGCRVRRQQSGRFGSVVIRLVEPGCRGPKRPIYEPFEPSPLDLIVTGALTGDEIAEALPRSERDEGIDPKPQIAPPMSAPVRLEMSPSSHVVDERQTQRKGVL